MNDPYLAIQVMMMPRDTNPHGTIFGGVILSYIDQAGAIGARCEVVRAGGALPALVTVAMNRVELKQPVLVGDVVHFSPASCASGELRSRCRYTSRRNGARKCCR